NPHRYSCPYTTLVRSDKIPLHQKALSEDAASLLPGEVRPALLWTIDLDDTGEGIAVDVRRARVESRARFDYAGVQARIDAGDADPMFDVLREIGELRIRREQRRGGISGCTGRTGAGRWRPAPGSRSRPGTNRSRCSPAWPPRT